MPNSTLKVKFNHDFDRKYPKHLALAEALDSIEVLLCEEQTKGSVGKIREKGSYEATWELKDGVEV